jgi:hypothetical protein
MVTTLYVVVYVLTLSVSQYMLFCIFNWKACETARLWRSLNGHDSMCLKGYYYYYYYYY